MRLSKRVQSLQPSPTLMLNAKAQEMKRNGIDVVNLTLGEPDFDTPIWIQESVTKAMQDGMTRYTPVDGVLPLKQAIQEKFERDYGVEYPLNMITIGSGTKQLIFNAMMATLDPGDEVIIPVPYWVSYPEIVRFCGGVAVFADTDAQTDFKLTVDELRFRITDRTKWVILNSPNNPSGAVYDRAELEAIAALLMKFPHVHILSDDIYELLTYDNRPFVSLVKVEPRLFHRVLICNGVSKSYAMTGFRLGFAAGPSDIIHGMNLLQSQSTSNVCSLSQAATIAALKGPHDFIDQWRATYDERRRYVFDQVNKIQGLSCTMPYGAFYVYVNCSALIGKKTHDGQWLHHDDDVVSYLLTTANVAVVSGSGFGLSPYFRISYATSLSNLEKGLVRIKEAVEALN